MPSFKRELFDLRPAAVVRTADERQWETMTNGKVTVARILRSRSSGRLADGMNEDILTKVLENAITLATRDGARLKRFYGKPAKFGSATKSPEQLPTRFGKYVFDRNLIAQAIHLGGGKELCYGIGPIYGSMFGFFLKGSDWLGGVCEMFSKHYEGVDLPTYKEPI